MVPFARSIRREGQLPTWMEIFYTFIWLIVTRAYTFITFHCLLFTFTFVTTKIKLILFQNRESSKRKIVLTLDFIVGGICTSLYPNKIFCIL